LDIRKVRRDAEAFVRAVDREFYENHAGLKEELNTSAIFDRYQHLFTPDAVAWIREYRKGAEGVPRPALSPLSPPPVYMGC
jgi:hypothetical protein